MKKSSKIYSTVTLIIFAVGCGGGTQGTGAYETGLPNNKDITTLTQEEQQRICQTLDEYKRDIISPDNLCTYSAMVNTIEDKENEKSCNSTKEICISSYDDIISQLDTSQLFTPCPVNTSSSIVCDKVSTVALLEQCINEAIDYTSGNYFALQCKDVNNFSSLEQLDQYAFRTTDDVPQTPACINLKENCPNIFN